MKPGLCLRASFDMKPVRPTNAWQVGDHIDDATILDSRGKVRTLAEFAQAGWLLIFVYRGCWCAFCLQRLAKYRDRYAQFRQWGVHMVALSVDTPADTARMNAILQLPFPLLCDPERTLIRSWGLLNADDFHTAFPATFLVDRNRQLRFTSVDDTYATARVEDVLALCISLRKGEVPSLTIGRYFTMPMPQWWLHGWRSEMRLRWSRRNAKNPAQSGD